MTTYNSTQYATKQSPSTHGLSGNVKVAYSTVATPSTLTTTDTLNMHYLPAGARVLYSLLKSSDLDTNGTPTIALNVGDAGSASRYFSASTVGQAGTASTATAAGGLDYANTSKTLVTIVPSTGVATGAAGTVELTQFYVVEGAAS